MFVDLVAQFLSGNEENMISYSTWVGFLLVFPDYALRHAMSAMFIAYSKIQSAKQTVIMGLQITNAQYIDETISYVGTSDVLDLKRYYIYMACVFLFLMVRIIFITRCTVVIVIFKIKDYWHQYKPLKLRNTFTK